MDVVKNMIGKKQHSLKISRKRDVLYNEIEEEIEYAKRNGYDYTKTDEYHSKMRQLEELGYWSK